MSAKDVYCCCFLNINQEKMVKVSKENELPIVTVHYSTIECGATFSSEDDLRRHLELEHSCEERTEYECGVCNGIFETQEECAEHYEECHVDIKPNHDVYVEPSNGVYGESSDIKPTYPELSYVGDSDILPEYCEEVYVKTELVDESKVKVRQKKVKPKKKQIFYCDLCDKSYTSKTILRYHMNIHTGDRPYQCDICPKGFTSPAFLQTHHRTHTGERPFKCPVCPKAFGNQAALWRHDRVHTGKKPYQCHLCLKFFTQSNSLKLHINTVHLKQPAPYKRKPKQMIQIETYKDDESLEAAENCSYQNVSVAWS